MLPDLELKCVVGTGDVLRLTFMAPLEDTTHIDVRSKKILVVFLKSCAIARIRGVDSKIMGLNRILSGQKLKKLYHAVVEQFIS